MTTSVKRQRLIAYIAEADDKKIKALYTLLEDTIQNNRRELLTDSQLRLLNEERRKHLIGEGKSYTLEESKAQIMNLKKQNAQT